MLVVACLAIFILNVGLRSFNSRLFIALISKWGIEKTCIGFYFNEDVLVQVSDLIFSSAGREYVSNQSLITSMFVRSLVIDLSSWPAAARSFCHCEQGHVKL